MTGEEVGMEHYQEFTAALPDVLRGRTGDPRRIVWIQSSGHLWNSCI